MNESRFLFVLDVIVLNLLDEGRRTYSLYRMCVLSLIILLALRRTCFSYKAVTEVCLRPVILLLIFTTRCNLFLSFWLMVAGRSPIGWVLVVGRSLHDIILQCCRNISGSLPNKACHVTMSL